MKTLFERLRKTSPALALAGALHVALLALFVAACAVDDRLIAGELAWVKPSKFAASITAYTLTLAWMLSFVSGRPRSVIWVGRVTAGAMWIETVLIATQALRGVRSHFNGATLLDGAIYSVMGAAIFASTVAGFVALWLLFRQHFEDRALGHALRLGLLVSLLGASMGGLMTRPSAEQLEQMALGGARNAGAHSVGVDDGGPGVPVVGWSTEGGDLRVPHFVGLHAMQVLPLLALAFGRSRAGRRLTMPARTRLVHALTVAYGGTFVVLVWQALRAEPISSPGVVTLIALVSVWTVATGMIATALLTARRDAALPMPTREMGVPRTDA